MFTNLLRSTAYSAIVLLTLALPSQAGASKPSWASSNSQYSAMEANRLTEAFDLAKKRRFERAARLFASQKTYDGLNYPAAQTVCETFVSAGEFRQALTLANELLARREKVSDSEKGVTVKLKADALAGLGELDSAVSNYQTAAKLYPGASYIILCHATELLFKAHKYDQTIRVADQALAFGSPNGMVNMYKGASYLKLRRPEQAVEALNLSIIQIEKLRKTKPDAFSIALSEDYRLIVSAYKLEGKTDLAAAAQKKSNSFASDWNDSLFGTPDPSLHAGN